MWPTLLHLFIFIRKWEWGYRRRGLRVVDMWEITLIEFLTLFHMLCWMFYIYYHIECYLHYVFCVFACMLPVWLREFLKNYNYKCMSSWIHSICLFDHSISLLLLFKKCSYESKLKEVSMLSSSGDEACLTQILLTLCYHGVFIVSFMA